MIGPSVAIGIGSSEPYKQWGASRFAELADRLLDAGWPRLFLVGGQSEAELARSIVHRLGDRSDGVSEAIDWNLADVAALLAAAVFYVGNDTGVMNIAAAVGTRTYGLFGGTSPLFHCRSLVSITPPDLRIDKAHGMARITVQRVVQAIVADRGALGPAITEPGRGPSRRVTAAT